ncbi:MAG TPA: CpaF/VirB11 family protein, partial [Frankiaceae bacterium]|nr:CpaF/VirB11 family protein [Frankiaceae bacterium]
GPRSPPRPGLTLRRHRLVDITLDDLVANATMEPWVAALLRAAVRAHCNVVVTGGMNAGKTTLVRALANEIDRAEKLVVVEKDYELALDQLTHRHDQVITLESRDANSEGAGEVTMSSLVTHGLRMNARRLIVGEVLGDEVIPMLKAMSSGSTGSLCTIHCRTPEVVFNRIGVLALSAAERLPFDAAHALTADAVDLVVHLDLFDQQDLDRTLRRRVTRIVEVVGLRADGRVDHVPVVSAEEHEPARLVGLPRRLPKLRRAGLDLSLLPSREVA